MNMNTVVRSRPESVHIELWNATALDSFELKRKYLRLCEAYAAEKRKREQTERALEACERIIDQYRNDTWCVEQAG